MRKGLAMQDILRATAELAEEKGLDNLSLLQIAEKLNIKSPSLYNHVGSLQELSEALAKLALDRLGDAVRTAADGRSKKAALTAIAGAYRRFACEHPQLYKAILRFPTYDSSDVREAGHKVTRILYQVMAPYRYSKADSLHFVRGFRSALHGFVALEEAGFFKNNEADVDESFRRLVASLLSTIG
ncbi:MAG: TetR/AcrR family transcriptional regulator [Sporolactobacillus sp.]|jgi:AcrR family transcriptional regulator|nr:TetR/AcrR family transcriptional regulator [Sporolactobacillus sp.]